MSSSFFVFFFSLNYLFYNELKNKTTVSKISPLHRWKCLCGLTLSAERKPAWWPQTISHINGGDGTLVAVMQGQRINLWASWNLVLDVTEYLYMLTTDQTMC